jgi:hypothetical protein
MALRFGAESSSISESGFGFSRGQAMRNALTLFLLFGAVLAGCEQGANLDAPRKFFEKHKIGSSPDYAVVKWNDPEDHVITIHGFVDDLKSCLIVAEAMNRDACSETFGENCLNPFSCQPLNH